MREVNGDAEVVRSEFQRPLLGENVVLRRIRNQNIKRLEEAIYSGLDTKYLDRVGAYWCLVSTVGVEAKGPPSHVPKFANGILLYRSVHPSNTMRHKETLSTSVDRTWLQFNCISMRNGLQYNVYSPFFCVLFAWASLQG